VGAAGLVIAFIFFFWQGIAIARRSTDRFSKLAATGICTWIIMQTFMNISSSIGIWPLSGIPLPFFSYGGSHIMTELAALGLLLNISKNG
jgi:cell division protein FtsW (lipid II flippase)